MICHCAAIPLHKALTVTMDLSESFDLGYDIACLRHPTDQANQRPPAG